MVKGFLMHLGYVESSSNACLLFKHHKGFDTVESALASLRECFVKGYERTHRRGLEHEFMGYEGWHCGRCGQLKHMHQRFEWNFEDGRYTDLIEQEVEVWASGDADNTHDAYEILESAGWSSFIGELSSLEGIIIIDQQGECCISRARIV